MSATTAVDPVAADTLAARGIEACERGHYKDALEMLERAAALVDDPRDLSPRALGAYGLALAFVRRRRLRDAIGFCRAAVARDVVNAELYLALGRVCLMAKKRVEAIKAFEAGLRVDPEHPELLRERDEMGVRKHPVIGFLSRDNPLNIQLGRIRHRMRQRAEESEESS